MFFVCSWTRTTTTAHFRNHPKNQENYYFISPNSSIIFNFYFRNLVFCFFYLFFAGIFFFFDKSLLFLWKVYYIVIPVSYNHVFFFYNDKMWLNQKFKGKMLETWKMLKNVVFSSIYQKKARNFLFFLIYFIFRGVFFLKKVYYFD